MAADPTKDPTQQAIVDAEAAAAARKAARDAANAEEAAALKAAQDAELAGVQAYNTAQYNNLGQIVGDIESKINVAKAKDETAQKRENAYRYISGLGDTLSSLANLVGTAHGAANQQQTYNSSAVVQKAEEARKARKIEMDDLYTRLDEMNARQRDLKAAGSLQEAQMQVQHKKEQMALEADQNKREREAAYKERTFAIDEANAQANLIRAVASQTSADKKGSDASKPEDEHTFEIADGKTVTIPKHKWTRTALSSVYSIIPDEMRTKRARMTKDVANRDVELKDASGNTLYYTATEQEMLNDIIKAAKVDENVANALKRIAGAGKRVDDPEFE